MWTCGGSDALFSLLCHKPCHTCTVPPYSLEDINTLHTTTQLNTQHSYRLSKSTSFNCTILSHIEKPLPQISKLHGPSLRYTYNEAHYCHRQSKRRAAQPHGRPSFCWSRRLRHMSSGLFFGCHGMLCSSRLYVGRYTGCHGSSYYCCVQHCFWDVSGCVCGSVVVTYAVGGRWSCLRV